MSDFNIVTRIEVVDPALRDYIVRQDHTVAQLRQALTDTTAQLQARDGAIAAERAQWHGEINQLIERVSQNKINRQVLREQNRSLKQANAKLGNERKRLLSFIKREHIHLTASAFDEARSLLREMGA